MISLNGAAARKGTVGDRIIIAAYGEFDEAELVGYSPKLVYVDDDNQVSARNDRIAVQATPVVC